ncbi:unnamed protein product [Camellia sinensis]
MMPISLPETTNHGIFTHRKLKTRAMAKELYFNHGGSATKKLLAGVDLVTELVGVTLGPKGRNVVLQNKYGPPKIVNDGETILKEIELEDPLENVGVKLVRQAGAKTNDIAGDGSTTSIVLAQGLISEGVKGYCCRHESSQISRGIEKTAKALVSELKQMSRELEDHELADVAAVSAGNDYAVGNMISDALRQVGRKGVVTIEKGNHAENALQIVEGMQFIRLRHGYLVFFKEIKPTAVGRTPIPMQQSQNYDLSPPGYNSPTTCRMVQANSAQDGEPKTPPIKTPFFGEDDSGVPRLQGRAVNSLSSIAFPALSCGENPKEMFKLLDNAVKEKYPIVIVAEGIEQEALAPVIWNELKGILKTAAIKAPAYGERKSHNLDDIAILTGGS